MQLALDLAAEDGHEEDGHSESVEHSDEVTNPILPAQAEMFFGFVAFALLFLLVRFVFLPKVQGTIDRRAEALAADRQAAAAAREKAVGASAELNDQLASVRAQAASIIDEARAEADTERQRLIGRAEREISALREVADNEITRQRGEAMESVQGQVSELAANAASRVLGRPVTTAEAGPIVDRYLASLN